MNSQLNSVRKLTHFPKSMSGKQIDLTDDMLCHLIKNLKTDKVRNSDGSYRPAHVLGVGDIQSGKTEFLIRTAIALQQKLDRPVIVFTRNSVNDRQQLSERLERHNENHNDIFRYDAIEKLADVNGGLFVQKRGIVILSYYQYIARCVEQMKKLMLTKNYREPVIIQDEADTLNTEGDEANRNITEKHFRELVDMSYCRISITATPLSLYAWDVVDQTIEIPRRANYYGFGDVTHIPISVTKLPPRKNPKGKIEYDAWADRVSLFAAMDRNLRAKESTMLITTSSKTADHQKTIHTLRKAYPHVLYIENNRRDTGNNDRKKQEPIKIYIPNKKEAVLDESSIASILSKYDKHPHIVIVSGIMANRGISFVAVSSQDIRGRHLTAQYVATGDKKPGDNVMQQALRLLGVYDDNPTLLLYCEQALYDFLKNNVEIIRQCTSQMVQRKLPLKVAELEKIVLAAVPHHMHRPLVAHRKVRGAPGQFERATTTTHPISNKLSEYTRIREKVAAQLSKIFDVKAKFRVRRQYWPQLFDLMGFSFSETTKIEARHIESWQGRGNAGAPKDGQVQIVWQFENKMYTDLYRLKKENKIPNNPKIEVVHIHHKGAPQSESRMVMTARG